MLVAARAAQGACGPQQTLGYPPVISGVAFLR
jgi:hypothetical protein